MPVPYIPFVETNFESLEIIYLTGQSFFINVLMDFLTSFNPLSANPTKWSNTLKQFIGKSRRIV